MTPWLFTSPWGALYLGVLVVLMTPCLLSHNKRWLALYMFMLFGIDRVTVNMLHPELALFFLAFAYTLVAFAVTITHRGTAARIMAAALAATSIAFIAGGFGLIDWDITGTLQEVCGLIAMLSVIWRRHDGSGFIHTLDSGPPGVRRDPARGFASWRSTRK
jgi:hypothetical protein